MENKLILSPGANFQRNKPVIGRCTIKHGGDVVKNRNDTTRLFGSICYIEQLHCNPYVIQNRKAVRICWKFRAKDAATSTLQSNIDLQYQTIFHFIHPSFFISIQDTPTILSASRPTTTRKRKYR